MNYRPANNTLVEHLEKWDLFSNFQYGFRFSQSTVDLLTVISDRIARTSNRSGTTQAAALEISKAFNRVWYGSLLPKLKPYGISGEIFGFISSFLSNGQLSMVLDGIECLSVYKNMGSSIHKNIQLILGFLKDSFFVLHFSYYTLNGHPDIICILLSMLMILLSTLSVIKHVICGNNKNWLLNLNVIYETMWTEARSGFVDFNAGKT